MAVLNFPPKTPSDAGDTYEENGVVYVWTGTYWQANTTSPTLDSIYVQVIGDNMTGALTLGGSNIILNADDGSASFTGNVQSGGNPIGGAEDGAVVRAGGNFNVSQSKYLGDTTNTILVYETGDSIPHLMIQNDGSIYSNPTSLSSSSQPENSKFALMADGSASFAGTITGSRSSDANFGLYVENTNDQYNSSLIGFKLTEPDGTYNPNFIYCTDSSSSPQKFIVKSDGTTYINGTEAGAAISLASDGSATFASGGVGLGEWGSNPGYNFVYVYAPDANSDVAAFAVYDSNAGEEIAAIKNNGSATFTGPVNVGNAWDVGDGVHAFNGGSLYIRQDGSGSGNNLLTILNGGNAAANQVARINGDGSASFAGGITSNQENYIFGATDATQRFLSFATTGESYYTATLRRDAWYLGSNVTNIGDTTPTGVNITLKMDGSATFASAVTVGPGNPSNGSSDGSIMYGSGGIGVSASSGPVITFNQTGVGSTGSINADGSATFAGTVKAEGDTSYVTVNRTGTLPASAALYLGFNNGIEKFKIAQDGSSTFAGSITTRPDTGISSAAAYPEGQFWLTTDLSITTPSIAVKPQDGLGQTFGVYKEGTTYIGPNVQKDGTGNPVDATIELNVDGSGSFAGPVAVGDIDLSDANGTGCEVSAGGLLYAQKPSGSSANALEIYQGTTPTVEISADGTISAANVTYSLDDGSTLDVKRVGTALKALKAAAAAASDFTALKSAIATALADI